MSTLFEWRIADIERKAERSASRLYELDTLRSDVDRLERENRELSACIDGLRAALESTLDRVISLETRITESTGEHS